MVTTFYQVEKDHKRLGLKIKSYINACKALVSGDNDGRRLSHYIEFSSGESERVSTIDHSTAEQAIRMKEMQNGRE